MVGLVVMVASGASASASPVAMPDHGTDDGAASPGTFFRDTGKFCRPFDMDRFRRVFPDRFSAFLREDLKGYSTEALAVMFSTDERTIRNWKAGRVSPSGPIVAMVISRFPDALPRLMGAA